MEKAYLVFTLHKDNFNGSESIFVDLFTNKEDAIKRVDEYSDAQINIEKAENFDVEFVPEEIYKFWPTRKVIYGKTVRTKYMEEYYYTYRYIIEKEFEK